MKDEVLTLASAAARSRIAGILTIVAMMLSLSLAVYAAPSTPPVETAEDNYQLEEAIPSEDVNSDDGFLGQLIIFLQPGTDPVAFGRFNGLTYMDTLKSDPDAHVFITGSQNATTLAMTSLSALPAVRQVYENRRTNNVLYGFVPNDPYFHRWTPAGWSGPGQWHLRNEFVAGRDINVYPAWAKWMTGFGVKMAVVDDCLQRTHPDLIANYDSPNSWDFGQSDADPSPVYTDDKHGTSTSGVAAARGGNGIGVTGAAPYAKIAGLRIDFPNQTTAMFVDATLFHSSGSNTDLKIKNHSYGISNNYQLASAEATALATSTGYGTIHVLSAGNDRGTFSQDSNKKMIQSSPNAITVAALGSNGMHSSYSCFGANVFCTAPSSSSGLYGITTTDRTGTLGYNGTDTFPDTNYTSVFGGTSSSAPTVAGALALAKQVQPALNKRLAKHLLARTCRVVHSTDTSASSDGGWHTNGAGLHFNQNYGFGLVDTDNLCYQARRYRAVSPLAAASTVTVAVSTPIPDNNMTGITRQFTASQTTPLEEVLIYLNVTHPFRGQVEAYLTSPHGTTSRLMYRSTSDSGDNFYWTFCTNAFWGEVPTGLWTLRVVDVAPSYTGTWNSYKATLNMGYPIPVNTRPTVTINQASTQPDPTEGPYVYYKVEFNEWVTDFTAADIAVSGTALPTTAAITDGAGRNYTVRVSGMTKHGTVIATIPAYGVHDAVGYANYASTSTDNAVVFNVTPKNSYVSPSSGSLAGSYKTVTSVHYDFNGPEDILKAYMLINDSLSSVNAAYMYYDRSLNKIYLRNDAGTAWSSGDTPGTSMRPIYNSQVFLDVAGTSVATSGNSLLVRWRIMPKASFSGKNLLGYLFVQDTSYRYDGWDQMGKYY